jgi:hypothetical protein
MISERNVASSQNVSFIEILKLLTKCAVFHFIIAYNIKLTLKEEKIQDLRELQQEYADLFEQYNDLNQQVNFFLFPLLVSY